VARIINTSLAIFQRSKHILCILFPYSLAEIEPLLFAINKIDLVTLSKGMINEISRNLIVTSGFYS